MPEKHHWVFSILVFSAILLFLFANFTDIKLTNLAHFFPKKEIILKDHPKKEKLNHHKIKIKTELLEQTRHITAELQQPIHAVTYNFLGFCLKHKNYSFGVINRFIKQYPQV